MKGILMPMLIAILITLLILPMFQSASGGSVTEAASACANNQYGISESVLGVWTCSLINYSQIIGHITGLQNETASSPSQCGTGQWQINTAESAAGALSITCSAPNQETASSPSACPNNQWQTQTTESAAGILTLTCTAPNQEVASNPAACTNGQYLTLVTESVVGALTLTCNNVPDVLQTCTSTCTLSSVTEAVDGNAAGAITLNLPTALLVSYYIADINTGTDSVCPPSGVNLYVGGVTYTNAACFSLIQNYQIFIWSDGTKYFGIATQIQWSSLTGFPANCAAGNYVYGLGATLTCAKPTNMAFTSNANTCTDTTNGGTGHMMGFATTYTTQAAPFIHTIMVTLNWKITSPTTVTTNTQYQFSYGSTSSPACNAAKTGTQIGNIYEYLNGIGQTTAPQRDFSETVVISGLTASTAYWFDLNVIDSSTASWIYSLPQISVIEQ